jgi:2,4-dienoyl-CoA reductase-like NADH-dependent reductase (Old Yellow Enzyme family)
VNEVLNNNVPLFVRISATEYAENGWNVEDSVALSKILKEKGVDLIDVSSGGNISGAKINVFLVIKFLFLIKSNKKQK